MEKPSVLFVCTANRIRSVMAEGVLLRYLRDKGIDPVAWQIDLAGTWTVNGLAPFPGAVSVMNKLGVDVQNHQSQVVTNELLANHNLVLVMEPGQKEALQAEFPTYSQRIFLLSEMVGEDLPIDDPIGEDLSAFEKVLSEIEACIQDGFTSIVVLANTRSSSKS